MGLSVVRIDADGLLKAGDRPIDVARRGQQVAQVVVHFGIVGPQPERGLEALGRTVHLAQTSERGAETIMMVRVSTVERDRSAQQVDRRLVADCPSGRACSIRTERRDCRSLSPNQTGRSASRLVHPHCSRHRGSQPTRRAIPPFRFPPQISLTPRRRHDRPALVKHCFIMSPAYNRVVGRTSRRRSAAPSLGGSKPPGNLSGSSSLALRCRPFPPDLCHSPEQYQQIRMRLMPTSIKN